ncbi:MAG: hypothetical protein JNJ56_04110 [Ignavibacteria bacterium]|nr:hypothetical protein [Ignavibacteria bacterium]
MNLCKLLANPHLFSKGRQGGVASKLITFSKYFSFVTSCLCGKRFFNINISDREDIKAALHVLIEFIL